MDPSCSLASRFSHLRYLWRVAAHGGDVRAIWDEPWHEDLVRKFVTLCAERKGIAVNELVMVHHDDLKVLFEDLHIAVDNRVIIRRYLAVPHMALQNLWSMAQLAVTALFVVWRACALVARPAAVQGIAGASVGIGIAMYVASARSARAYGRSMSTPSSAHHSPNPHPSSPGPRVEEPTS
jgi:hypothetical protein